MTAKVLLCVAAVWCLASPVAADTVLLANGGQVDGTVDAVILSSEGSARTIHRGVFVNVLLGDSGTDEIKLDDGSTVTGRVESLQVKSVGGILALKREEVRAVKLVSGPADETRDEYLAKRAEVKDTDAVGLYELANWCKQKELTAEVHQLARLSLTADPNSKVADLAHLLLGHIVVDGQWREPPPLWADAGSTTEPAVAEVKASSEAIALFKKLNDEYIVKEKQASEKDQAAIKTQYQKQVDATELRLKQLTNEMERLDRRRVVLRDRLRREQLDRSQSLVLQDEIDDNRLAYDQKKKDYQRTYEAGLALAEKIRAAKASARDRAAARAERMDIARIKIDRLLRIGKQLTEPDMRAIFEAALNEPPKKPG